MVINRVIKRVPNRFFRTWDLYYLTGWDLGFQSKTGTRFKTKSVHRMLEAKNIHRDYGILNKNWGWDDVGLRNPIWALLKGVGPREKAGRLLHMFFRQLFIHTNLINAKTISELYEKLVTATLFNKVSLHRNHCLQYICLFN